MKHSILFILVFSLPLLAAGEDYTHYKQGKKAWFREEWKEASVQFKKVIQDFPDSQFYQNSLYFLGFCEFKEKDYQNAFDHLSEFLESPGIPSAYNDAAELRLKAAFEIAKTRPHMKRPLREALQQRNVDLCLMSASLLLQLHDTDVFDALFEQMHDTGSPRTRQKISQFIEEHGGKGEMERLNNFYQANEPHAETHSRRRMLQLTIRNKDQEVLNISIPMTFAEYFQDILSDEQKQCIRKETKGNLEDIFKDVNSLKKGDVLLQINDKDGSTIKIVVN